MSELRIAERPEAWFVGVGGSGPFTTARRWVMRLWDEVRARADALPAAVDRSVFLSPCHGRPTDLSCYIGFSAPGEVVDLPDGWVSFRLPARTYAVGAVRGQREAIDRTYQALPRWAEQQGRPTDRSVLWLEIYPEPPGSDPAGPFDFEVWLPLGEKYGAVPDGRLLGAVTHVQLPAADLDRAVAWYAEVLGFEVYLRPHGDLAILRLSAGPTLFLWRTADATTANFTRDGEDMPAIGISCADAAALRARLEAAGAPIVLWNVEPNFATFLKFRDPFGNVIVVHQDHR